LPLCLALGVHAACDLVVAKTRDAAEAADRLFVAPACCMLWPAK